MNNGCLVRPKKALLAMRGGSLRFMNPRRITGHLSLGNRYEFLMSSNTTQASGIGGLVNSVEASSEYNVIYRAWKAFNKFNGTGYYGWFAHPGSTSSWLRVNFNYAIVVRRIDIVAHSDYFSYAPKTFTIEGGNDGSAWDILSTQTEVPAWAANERRTYAFSNNTAYLYYRINVTDVENLGYGSGCAYIGEMEFYD
jgi:hypothetical protein